MKPGHSWGESAKGGRRMHQAGMHQAGNVVRELRVTVPSWAGRVQLPPRPLCLVGQELPAGPWPGGLGII